VHVLSSAFFLDSSQGTFYFKQTLFIDKVKIQDSFFNKIIHHFFLFLFLSKAHVMIQTGLCVALKLYGKEVKGENPGFDDDNSMGGVG